MSITQEDTRKLMTATSRLATLDPTDERVARFVEGLKNHVSGLSTQGSSSVESLDFLKSQISKLQMAAEIPANNYMRVVEIFKGLSRAAQACERPQYAALRPRIAAIVEKVAGVFSEVDTVQDLDKPLAQIEKAVHGLYGDQSKNATYFFQRRNKGHHSE